MTISRLQRTASHEPTALSRGERVSGSGAFIRRSMTGEGSIPRAVERAKPLNLDVRTKNNSNGKGQMANGKLFGI
jgi:hypothetical protein